MTLLHRYGELLPARHLRRYRRFLADVELPDGRCLTVHVPNTGSLRSALQPGWEVRLLDSHNPRRRYRYTLELSRAPTSWIMLHTQRANHLAARILAAGLLPDLPSRGWRREVPYGTEGSRVDLYHPVGRGIFLEVKSVTLRMPDGAYAFPDAVTERGQKHLRELTTSVATGARAVLLFVVVREDGAYFRPADEIDPEYGRLLRQAADAGVEVRAVQVRVRPSELHWGGAVSVCL